MLFWTEHQKKYHVAFTSKLNQLLQTLFAPPSADEDWLDVLEKRLDQTSTAVGVVGAVVTVAAVAAVPTGGLSLAAAGVGLGVAGATIMLAQTTTQGYRVVMRSPEDASEVDVHEMTRDEQHLLAQIYLDELADIETMRHCDFLERIIEPSSIVDFAEYGAERIIKKIKEDLKECFNEQKKNIKAKKQTSKALTSTDFYRIFNPKELSEHLTKSIHLAAFQISEKIQLRSGFSWNNKQEFPVKWAYGRKRVVFFRFGLTGVDLFYFKSKNEANGYSNTDTSIESSGYMPVPAPLDLLETTEVMTWNGRELVRMHDQKLNLNHSFCLEYEIDVNDVLRYLQKIRLADPNEAKLSFNEYLSAYFNIRVIATCHDERLKHIDLSSGNFSGVNFRDVTLEGNLEETIFDHARLKGAKLSGVTLHGSSFCHAHLQKTIWERTDLCGNLSYAKMNAASIKNHSTLGKGLDINCDWYLTEIDETVKGPWIENDDFRKQTEERLTLEHQMRVKNDEILNQALKKYQEEQEKNWVEQRDKNHYFLGEIDKFQQWFDKYQKEPIDKLLKKIHRLNDDLYQAAIAKPFVELNMMETGVGEKSIDSFGKPIEFFCQQHDRSVFLLHGSIGAGKSTGIHRLLKKLSPPITHDSHVQNHCYPILIKLKQVNAKGSENLLDAALKALFTDDEIELLKKNVRCLIILDGLGEHDFDITQRYIIKECMEFIQSCNDKSWKIMVVARVQALIEIKDYRERLRLSEEKSFDAHALEYSVMHLGKRQINSYIDQYYRECAHVIYDQLDHLYTMAQNPAMLHIICEVFSKSHEASELTSSAQFYDSFIKNWAREALPANNIHQLKPESNIIYLEDLAHRMYMDGVDVIQRDLSDEEDVPDVLEVERSKMDKDARPCDYLFHNPIWREAASHAHLSVSRVGTTIGYRIKDPFRSHFLAKKLLKILDDRDAEKRLKDWNYQYLTQTKAVYVFDSLLELILEPQKADKKEKRIMNLLEMVLASKANSAYSKAASNAITLLNRLKFDFSEKLEIDALRGIAVPYAQLAGALLSNLDLSKSDFSHVCFQRAMLLNARMRDANVTNARFSEALSSFYPSEKPEKVTFYVSSKIIMTYSVKLPHSEAREIRNVDIEGISYPSFYGHKKEIQCMSWGGVRLASASGGKQIRIWQVVGQEGKRIKTLSSETVMSISSLQWLPQGLLASAGDKTLNLWNVEEGLSVFQYSGSQPIRHVLFNEESQKLIAGEGNSFLCSWHFDDSSKTPVVESPEKEHAWWSKKKNQLSCLTLSGDKKHLAAGCKDGMIYIREFGKTRRYLKNEVVAFLKGHRGTVTSILWKDKSIISASQDGTVRVWNPERGALLAVFYGDGSAVSQIAWAPGERQIIVVQERIISVLDPLQLQEISKIELNQVLQNASKASQQVSFGDVHEASTSSSDELPAQDIRKRSPQDLIALDPNLDGSHQEAVEEHRKALVHRALSGSQECLDDNETQLHESASNELFEMNEINYRITCIAPFRDLLAIGYGNGRVLLREHDCILSHTQAIQSMLWSSDGSYLAVLDEEGKIQILDIKSKTADKPFWEIVQTHSELTFKQILWLETFQHQDRFAAVDTEGYIHVWQREDHEWDPTTSLMCQPNEVSVNFVATLCLKNDDHEIVKHQLALVDLIDIHIWDLKQESSQSLKYTHKRTITAIFWSPDGQYLAFKDCEEKVFVWGLEKNTIESDKLEVEHKKIAWVSHDKNQWLIVGSSSDIRIFDANRLPNLKQPIKTISSGIDGLVHHGTDVFLVGKRYIDVMDAKTWLTRQSDEKAKPFKMRLGHGPSVRELDLNGAIGLENDAKRYLKNAGSQLSSESLPSWKDKIKLSIFTFTPQKAQGVFPLPIDTSSKHEEMLPRLSSTDEDSMIGVRNRRWSIGSPRSSGSGT